jgi:hypothetical protein
VIGAGAAMLPPGAAAGASARILRSLPDQGDGGDDQLGTRNGQPKNLVLTDPERGKGQAARHPGTASDMPRTLHQRLADEDEAGERELERQQRRIRLRAKQSDRLRMARRPVATPR